MAFISRLLALRSRDADRRSLTAPSSWAAPFALSALGALAVSAGCDGTPRALDAAAVPSARMSALSVRLDVATNQQPTLTALGFRAAFSGTTAPEVLGLVDPLATASPARDCELRDLDNAAAGLAARGDGIELEELAGLSLSLKDVPGVIRPSARLYPDVAPAIGGVVSEAGPLALGAWPVGLRITAAATADMPAIDTQVTLPAAARIATVNGQPSSTVAAVSVATSDLTLGLGPDAADGAVEVRPFGATVALVCKVPGELAGAGGPVSFVVPRQLVASLVSATGAAPGGAVAASLDLVRRMNGDATRTDPRIAVEIRASALVELRP